LHRILSREWFLCFVVPTDHVLHLTVLMCVAPML
jgi:hypothetical protein